MACNQSASPQQQPSTEEVVDKPTKKSFNFFARDPSVKITQYGHNQNKMRVVNRRKKRAYEQEQHILMEEFHLPHYRDKTSNALQTRMVGQGHLSHWFLNNEIPPQRTTTILHDMSESSANDTIQVATKTTTMEGITKKKKRLSHPPKDHNKRDPMKYMVVVMPYAIPFANTCPHDVKQSPVLVPRFDPSSNMIHQHSPLPSINSLPNLHSPGLTSMFPIPLHHSHLPSSYSMCLHSEVHSSPPSYEEAISSYETHAYNNSLNERKNNAY